MSSRFTIDFHLTDRSGSGRRPRMLIVYGRSVNHERIGYCAGFCPICHDIQPLAIQKIISYGHVYGMATDRPCLHGYQAECPRCGMAYEANDHRYPGLIKELPDSGRELIRRTNPRLAERQQERFFLERQIRRNPHELPAQVRAELILEPLLLTAAAAATIDESGWAFLAHLFGFGVGMLAPLGIVLWAAMNPGLTNYFIPGMAVVVLIVAGAGLGWLFKWKWSHSPSKLRIQRQLLRGLYPLKPTPEELAAAWAIAKEQKAASVGVASFATIVGGLAELHAGHPFGDLNPPQLSNHFESALDLLFEPPPPLAATPAAPEHATTAPAPPLLDAAAEWDLNR